MYLEFKNINDSFINLSKVLMDQGVKRETRGKICYEINEPILIKIINPTDRYLNVPRKGYNKYLPFAELLNILSGTNDLSLSGFYSKNLYNYSDDGIYMRAMYSRIRNMSGVSNDYKLSKCFESSIKNGTLVREIDQLKYIIESFKRDINTRQAVIEIGDNVKDGFDENGLLKITKDFPCTRSLMFQIRDGKLDLTVTMRSNDHVWGAHSINFTNFTFIQECVSKIIGVGIGNYYHMANNYHFYLDTHNDLLKEISKLNSNDYKSKFSVFQYVDKFDSLENFDKLISELFLYEQELRKDKSKLRIDLKNDLFNDWALVFFNYHTKSKEEFINPFLNDLFYGIQNC